MLRKLCQVYPKGPKDLNMEYVGFNIEIIIMVLGTYLLFGSLDP